MYNNSVSNKSVMNVPSYESFWEINRRIECKKIGSYVTFKYSPEGTFEKDSYKI